MPDHRTKRQKVQALYDAATTPGEKAAAKAALNRMGPEPEPPLQPYQQELLKRAKARRPTGPYGYSTPFTEWGDPLTGAPRSYNQARQQAAYADAVRYAQTNFEEFSRGFRADWTCPHGAVKGLCQLCNPAPNQKPFRQCKHGNSMAHADDEYAKDCKPCDLEKQAGYRAKPGPVDIIEQRRRRNEGHELARQWFSADIRRSSGVEHSRVNGLVSEYVDGKISINDLRQALGKEPI